MGRFFFLGIKNLPLDWGSRDAPRSGALLMVGLTSAKSKKLWKIIPPSIQPFFLIFFVTI
ncbi:MAG: hypothetical protein EAZ68_11775 [Oscillatoriales cyanobacterium]|nr:MAG: hypothetical protein EAZ68_11775 [Oscillatoriales cyanobacterium]